MSPPRLTFDGQPDDHDPWYRLWVALEDAYQAAGSPSTRAIGVRAQERGGGAGPSHTTVAQMLTGRRVPSWQLTEAVFSELGRSPASVWALWRAADAVRHGRTQAERIRLAHAAAPGRERAVGMLCPRPRVALVRVTSAATAWTAWFSPHAADEAQGRAAELATLGSGEPATVSAVDVEWFCRDFEPLIRRHGRDRWSDFNPTYPKTAFTPPATRQPPAGEVSFLEWCVNHDVLLMDSLCEHCRRPVCDECSTRWSTIRCCSECAGEFEDRRQGKPLYAVAEELRVPVRDLARVLRTVRGIDIAYDRTWRRLPMRRVYKDLLGPRAVQRIQRYRESGDVVWHISIRTPGSRGFARHAPIVGATEPPP